MVSNDIPCIISVCLVGLLMSQAQGQEGVIKTAETDSPIQNPIYLEQGDSKGGITTVNFFPPQRSMFPDHSPGRVNPLPKSKPTWPKSSLEETPVEADPFEPVEPPLPWVWGGIGFRAIPTGQKMAPNGVFYKPVFSIDLELNIALCDLRTVYLFSATRFWGQKAGENITNSSQGDFDFSKRQFDLSGGLAWNYWHNWEARAFVYSYNNLNRGTSLAFPDGYNDGVGISNRWYYFDDNFFGVGYLPTKELIGNDGSDFKPSWFMESNIWVPIVGQKCQGYWASSLIAQRPGEARLFYNDVGVATRVCKKCPQLEFRTGSEITTDLVIGKTYALYYLGVFVPF
ncbi:MAG: hypothetical protein EXR99_04180 [Gemmataceae bacterium]|nr:hypothetical protein [Gemmataceae bacterium]